MPQRPFTQGASSTEPSTTPAAPLPLRTGDWERRDGGSGPSGAGVALMGEGRELRLGLRGARPDGAWENTTTHWPTWRGEEGRGEKHRGFVRRHIQYTDVELFNFKVGNRLLSVSFYS